MVTMGQIESLCRKIVERFRPLRILLFGSYATGAASTHSDVDIMVIMPFEGRPFVKSLEILNFANPDFPVDLLAVKPGDTERRYSEGDPLIREALDHGKVLYERDN